MLIFENINLAITSLKSNKMRALLTMLGIIIGIAAVISIFTVGNSLTISISENMQSLGANDVYAILSPKTEDDKVDMDEVDGIRYGSFQSGGELSKDDMITPDMIIRNRDCFYEKRDSNKPSIWSICRIFCNKQNEYNSRKYVFTKKFWEQSKSMFSIR